jgi:galactoside O-acetyltransferase
LTSRYEEVRARMNAGELYVDYGEGLEQLEAERTHGKELLYDFNHTRPGDTAGRARLLRELLGSLGKDAWIEPPFFASYGSHIHIGDAFYANFNLVVVDDGDVHIGDRVMFGPNVTISTTGHPVEPALRVGGAQFSVPVHIEDDVWIGGNVSVMPGVTVGAGSVIGAGSVVTRDIPARVVAAGAPCRVLRPIGPEDRQFSFRRPERASGLE